MTLDEDQNPNKEPTVLLRWQWAPSQPSTAGLGMPCLQGRPLKHEIAQLHVLSAGHAFSEKLPHYPATAYVQKTYTHSTHILNFTAQRLIWLKFKQKWVAMQCNAMSWHLFGMGSLEAIAYLRAAGRGAPWMSSFQQSVAV